MISLLIIFFFTTQIDTFSPKNCFVQISVCLNASHSANEKYTFLANYLQKVSSFSGKNSQWYRIISFGESKPRLGLNSKDTSKGNSYENLDTFKKYKITPVLDLKACFEGVKLAKHSQKRRILLLITDSDKGYEENLGMLKLLKESGFYVQVASFESNSVGFESLTRKVSESLEGIANEFQFVSGGLTETKAVSLRMASRVCTKLSTCKMKRFEVKNSVGGRVSCKDSAVNVLCVFSCAKGYRVVKESAPLCVDGDWQGNPACLKNGGNEGCPAPLIINGFISDCGDREDFKICTVNCKANFLPVGESKIICASFRWNYTEKTKFCEFDYKLDEILEKENYFEVEKEIENDFSLIYPLEPNLNENRWIELKENEPILMNKKKLEVFKELIKKNSQNLNFTEETNKEDLIDILEEVENEEGTTLYEGIPCNPNGICNTTCLKPRGKAFGEKAVMIAMPTLTAVLALSNLIWELVLLLVTSRNRLKFSGLFFLSKMKSQNRDASADVCDSEIRLFA